jgi:hypothetical protein
MNASFTALSALNEAFIASNGVALVVSGVPLAAYGSVAR